MGHMMGKKAALLMAILMQLTEVCTAGTLTFRRANPVNVTEGSDATFEWSYSLKDREQKIFHELTFGKWKNGYIEKYLITVLTSDESVIPEPTLSETRQYYIRRFSWVGDLTQSRVAFHLSNASISDGGNYGCRLGIGKFKEIVSEKIVLNVKPAPPPSFFSKSPPKRTAVIRHHPVHFAWKYSLNDLDKKAFKALVWGRYINMSFVPLYTVNSTTTQATEDPRYSGRISIKRYEHDSGCSFQLSNVDWSDQGWYEARLVKDKDGILLRSRTNLFVHEEPKITKLTSKSKVIKEEELLILTCKAKGVPSPRIIWKKDGNVIQDNRGTSYVVEKVNLQDSGRYTCVAKNEAGNVTSPEILVKVKSKPKCEREIQEVGCFTDDHTKPRLQKFVLSGNHPQVNEGNDAPTGDDRTPEVDSICRCAQEVLKTEYTYFVLHRNECWSVPDWNERKENCTPHSFTTSEKTKTYIIYALQPSDSGKSDEPKMQKDFKEPAEESSALNKHYTILVYAVAAVAVAAAVFIALLCVISRRHRAKGVRNLTVIESISRDKSAVNASRTDQCEFPRNRLIIDRVVGTGAFGVVCRGHAFDLPGLSGWTTVAIKTLPGELLNKISYDKVLDKAENACNDVEKRDLLSELRLLKNLKAHPHVIKLLGYIVSSDSPMVIVEYVPHGDLLGYLRKSRGAHDNYYNVPEFKSPTNLTSRQLLRFAWQISDGMEFLSSMKIVHRDLAARNVLVGEGGKCKITDFGMARNVNAEEIYFRSTAGRIPIKWTAIEAITGRHEYSTQSDVWSFGVVLYEIFTIGGEPFPGICVQKIPRILQTGYRMSKPRHVDDELYSIMLACWKAEPQDRPTFASLRATIKALEARDWNYVNVQDCIFQYGVDSG